jgi:hypothetical protein
LARRRLVLLLAIVVLMFLRLALMLSLLFLSPAATVVRQLQRLLRIKPAAD